MSVSTASVAPSVAEQQTPVEKLFQPIKLGRYNLPHRIVMANTSSNASVKIA